MPARKKVSSADRSGLVLLIIDAISDFDFEDGARLARAALPAARRIARLKARVTGRGIPTVYANDNFGRWRSNFAQVVERSLQDRSHGRRIAELLRPAPDDYSVLKPRHSAFYATPLELLLRDLGARRLILAGFSTEACVFASAMDAHLRGFEVVVVSDCVASASSSGNSALQLMRKVLHAQILPSSALRLLKIASASGAAGTKCG